MFKKTLSIFMVGLCLLSAVSSEARPYDRRRYAGLGLSLIPPFVGPVEYRDDAYEVSVCHPRYDDCYWDEREGRYLPADAYQERSPRDLDRREMRREEIMRQRESERRNDREGRYAY